MLEISFARFRPSMAMPNTERAPSRPFDCLGLVVIVENRDGCGREVGYRGRAHKGKAQAVIATSGNFVTICLAQTHA